MSKIDFKNIDLIILDFDGPINNLSQAKVLTFKSFFRLFGIKIKRKILMQIVNYIDQFWETEKNIDYRQILKFTFRKIKSQNLLKISEKQERYFIKNYTNFLEKNQRCNKALIKLIQKIKNRHKNIKICIYSAQTKLYIRKFLYKFKINPHLFDAIYTGESFNEPKPSIKNLEIICKELKVLPHKTLIIGDNVVIDLMPAKLLGMKTILYSKMVDKLIRSNQELRQLSAKI